MVIRALSMLLCLLPATLAAQDRLAPLPLADPPLSTGMVRGVKVGSADVDTGFVARLPRIATHGKASYAIETDTLDFRPKWTLRLRLEGSDSMEVVLRCADTLPPQPRTYDIILLSSGVSHANPQFLAGELRLWDRGKRRTLRLGGGYDRITFGEARGGALQGAVAVVGARRDYSDSRLGQLGRWQYRGLEATFTARAAPGPEVARQLTVASEVRMMGRALDGLLASWIGAVNGDGQLPDRTSEGIRAFITHRWGPAVVVDSVAVQGEHLWVLLRGRTHGMRCSQGTSDLHPACTGPTHRRS